jgi:alpha(1,3/1,4) fucosyltransferase
MIYLYPIGTLNNTIFIKTECLRFLREHDIALTDNINHAVMFILRSLTPPIQADLEKRINCYPHNGQPVLVWTHEPRFTVTNQEQVFIKDFPVHIMNLYTRNVYFSNFTHYGYSIDRVLAPVADVKFSERPIAGLATYVYPELQRFIMDGKDIDLAVKRQHLLLAAFDQQLIDIYGKGWPSSVSVSESRGPGWHDIKLNILKQYQFNICMENTSFDYYCSEKIWDSIKGYCLPVYSSFNNRIYDNFPKNSFIDYDEFASDKELVSFIKGMSKKEYLQRMNLCIETFNRLHAAIDLKTESQQVLEAVVAKIRSIFSTARPAAFSNH